MWPMIIAMVASAAMAAAQARAQAKQQEKNRQAQLDAASMSSQTNPFAGGQDFFGGSERGMTASPFMVGSMPSIPQAGGTSPGMAALGSIVSSPYLQQLYGANHGMQANPYMGYTSAGPYMSYMSPNYGPMISTGTSPLNLGY